MRRAASLHLDGAWWMWVDVEAQWRDDPLYLPDETSPIERLPVNPPTGGWATLDREVCEGRCWSVRLPATVEQYAWGRYGKRVVTQAELFFAPKDPLAEDGVYRGVSWWWYDVVVPAEWKGDRVRLHVPAARLRAEVYVNERLCGYDIVAETPFDFDITSHIEFGVKNRIAIRITNPGGRLDWVDFHDGSSEGPDAATPLMLKWGRQTIPLSHGFGGLDDGIRLDRLPRTFVDDVWIRNRADIVAVDAVIAVQHVGGDGERAKVEVVVRRCGSDQIVWMQAFPLQLATGDNRVELHVRPDEVEVWAPEQPTLYEMEVALIGGDGAADRVSQIFGFRWFTAEGLGEKAVLRLNGRRIRLRSAISWSFWSGAGLFPSQELAAAEVEAARALGLNMLTCHRNIGAWAALDASDAAGLLRWQEPGAGRSQWTGDTEFERAYARIKMERMMRRDRSRPGLVGVCLQNEQVSARPEDERVVAAMTAARALDPDRIIVLKSAFADAENTPADLKIFADQQAFFLPGDERYHRDRGDGWSGWWDNHTVGGGGVYQDWIYLGPSDFSHGSDRHDEIVVWGEALGSASPDPYGAAVNAYNRGVVGWERDMQSRQFRVFDSFLDQSGFRTYFRDVDSFTRAIADRTYHFWARVIENARISDAVDAIALSGWESEPFDQHCGIVDCARRLKADPSVFRRSCGPIHVAIKPRGLVHAVGQLVLVDLYIVNETRHSGTAQVTLTLQGPNQQEEAMLYRGAIALPEGDTAARPIKDAIACTLDLSGYWTLTATLETNWGVEVFQERMFVPPGALSKPDAFVVEPSAHLREILQAGLTQDEGKVLVVADYGDGTIALDPRWMDRIREGGKCVLIADGSRKASEWADELQSHAGSLIDGMVGPALASWMGSWYVAGDDAVLSGLPVRCALGWEYQADPRGRGAWFDETALCHFGDAPVVRDPCAKTIIAYGRDHHDRIGSALFRWSYGAGSILFCSIGGLYSSLSGKHRGVHPETAKALVRNMVMFG